MMNGKVKKVLMVMLTAMIGGTIFVGCGNRVDDSTVEKILNAKNALLGAKNLSLRNEVITEAQGESQSYMNDAVVNNDTSEWYGAMGNVTNGDMAIFNEILILPDGMYNRFQGEEWQIEPKNNRQIIYGLENISNIELDSKDCKELKETKVGDNTVLSISTTKDYTKKVKKEAVKTMEKLMDEYKNNPNVTPEAVDSNMANFEALKKTNYKEISYIFTIDKEGVLIGYENYFAMEQPEVIPSKGGKFELGEEMIELKMTNNIIINSYNDEKNVEFINKLKEEIK